MTGALQVFSNKAIVILSYQRGSCTSRGALPEDAWLQSCMNTLGINGISLPVVQDATCGSAMSGVKLQNCSNFSYAAFHPLPTLDDMERCSAQAGFLITRTTTTSPPTSSFTTTTSTVSSSSSSTSTATTSTLSTTSQTSTISETITKT